MQSLINTHFRKAEIEAAREFCEPPKPYFQNKLVTLYHGDAREVMPELGGGVTAVVTDPPWEIGFMGKAWDRSGIAFDPEFWELALDCCLPGAHLLSFGGPRTFHRVACAIEDAGWQLRETIMYLFGSGFPKSHNVYKAINNAVDIRYGTTTRCDCLDARNGSTAREGTGHGNRDAVRIFGHTSGPSSPEVKHPVVPIDTDQRADSLRQLQQGNSSTAKGSQEIEETILQHDLCGSGTEEARHGHAPIRPGMEEQTSGDKVKGQSVPSLRKNTGGERRRVARASSKAIPSRWNKPTGEPSGALRGLPSQDGVDNQPSYIFDRDRREPHRLLLDDQCGWPTAVAYICSWCGRPDKSSLETWQGYGSALKPAFEPIILARKPLSGTVVANVTEHGCGALNIDGCRVEASVVDTDFNRECSRNHQTFGQCVTETIRKPNALGRWPANVLHDGSEEVVGGFPESVSALRTSPTGTKSADKIFSQLDGGIHPNYGDSGSAARFFYCAKASGSERDDNTHATVKPLALMEYLCRLIKQPAVNLVLDPFAGSGSTLLACELLGISCIGIEADEGHCEIIAKRFSKPAEPYLI